MCKVNLNFLCQPYGENQPTFFGREVKEILRPFSQGSLIHSQLSEDWKEGKKVCLIFFDRD